jgi:hypothetical protein
MCSTTLRAAGSTCRQRCSARRRRRHSLIYMLQLLGKLLLLLHCCTVRRVTAQHSISQRLSSIMHSAHCTHSGQLVRLATHFQRVLVATYNQRVDSLQNATARATLQSRMLALTAEFERLYARLRFDMRIGQHHLRSAQYNRRMLVQDAEVRVYVHTVGCNTSQAQRTSSCERLCSILQCCSTVVSAANWRLQQPLLLTLCLEVSAGATSSTSTCSTTTCPFFLH